MGAWVGVHHSWRPDLMTHLFHLFHSWEQLDFAFRKNVREGKRRCRKCGRIELLTTWSSPGGIDAFGNFHRGWVEESLTYKDAL